MSEITPETLKSAISGSRNDWKSVVSLLLAALTFAGGFAWMVTGYVLKGAEANLKNNSERITSVESKQNVYESEIKSFDKRQDEMLAELRTLSIKIGAVSESQARMEGIILATKK